MAIFDKQKKGESGQTPPKAPAAPLETPELYLQTVSMMANLLISNTAAMLGKVPHPDSGQTFRNLEAAELLIDLLQTLREKSSAKLPAEAQQQIGRAISDLQMLYVEEASVSGDFSKANEMRKEAETTEKAVEQAQKEAAVAAKTSSPVPAESKPSQPEPKAPAENKVKFSKKYE
jgi:hypothetical protein